MCSSCAHIEVITLTAISTVTMRSQCFHRQAYLLDQVSNPADLEGARGLEVVELEKDRAAKRFGEVRALEQR